LTLSSLVDMIIIALGMPYAIPASFENGPNQRAVLDTTSKPAPFAGRK
jgi:hypothetical protein